MAKWNRSVSLLLLAIAAAASLTAAEKAPVYVYLYSRFGDFVNIDLTETRIRDSVAAVEKIRQKFPESGPTLTVLVSGALSQALAERNAKTQIKDFLMDAARRGVIEFGYDGTDEPTYSFRPYADLTKLNSAEERWAARAAAMEQFLTEARDPATGKVQTGKSGGLKAMQEVFGEAACIIGLNNEFGGDSEYIHQIRRYNTKAIMWGLPDPDPARAIHGYRGSVMAFGASMSPIAGTSPELHWIDNVLRSSETSDAAIRRVSAMEGPAGIQTVLKAVSRGRVRIIHLEVGELKRYLSEIYRVAPLYPPIKVAYEHPENPLLPQEAFPSPDAVDAAKDNQDALLQWLAGEFFHSETASRFVSSTGLARMSPSNIGGSISVAELETSLKELVKTWGMDTYPPNYLTVGNRFLSLADAFGAMANILAEQKKTGRRPESVRIVRLYGPIETPDEHGPALGTVSAASVANICTDMTGRLNDDSWKPMPSNMIPAWVDVNGLRLTAGQFFRLMAESIIAPSLDATIKVKMTYNHSIDGLQYPKTRLPIDQGGTWTFRPAPLPLSRVIQAAR